VVFRAISVDKLEAGSAGIESGASQAAENGVVGIKDLAGNNFLLFKRTVVYLPAASF